MNKPAKAFDLDKMEFVKPTPAATTPPADPKPGEGTEAPKEGEPAKEEGKEGEEPKDPKADPPKEGEGKEGTDAQKEGEEPKEGKEGEEPKPKDEPKPAEIDAEITKKYGIKTKEDLNKALGSIDLALAEIKDLEKKLEDKKPEFESEQQAKAFEFIKNLDPSKWGDGIHTLGRLWTMDADKEDGRIVLEEAFALEHPELTREQSQKKFSKIYASQYADPEKDDFKDDAEFKEAKEDRAIDRQIAETKARKFVKAKQEEFKAKPKSETKPVKNEAVVQAIQKNEKTYTEEVGKITELVFSPSDNDDDDFPLKFSKEQLDDIRAMCHGFIKIPANYSEKGELVDKDLTPEELFKRAAYYKYGDEIVAKNYEHAQQIASIARAEEVGKVKPERKVKVNGATPVPMSEEEQIAKLIKDRKEKSQKKRLVAA